MCENCPAGTFSSGDSFEITKWDEIPEGFYSELGGGLSSNEECKK